MVLEEIVKVIKIYPHGSTDYVVHSFVSSQLKYADAVAMELRFCCILSDSIVSFVEELWNTPKRPQTLLMTQLRTQRWL